MVSFGVVVAMATEGVILHFDITVTGDKPNSATRQNVNGTGGTGSHVSCDLPEDSIGAAAAHPDEMMCRRQPSGRRSNRETDRSDANNPDAGSGYFLGIAIVYSEPVEH